MRKFSSRSYHNVDETSLYYLQSRYYDANIGRFINSDVPDVILGITVLHSDNLFCYCCNAPVNEKDEIGSLIASAVGKFVLYAVFGLFVQFTCDIIEFLIRKFIRNKKISFSISPLGDYLGSALSWGMSALNLFDNKLAAFLAPFVPVMVKHLTNIIVGSFSWYGLLADVISAFVAAMISVALNNSMKNKLSKVKRGKGNRYSEYARYLKKQQNIKININKSFFKASIAIIITTSLIQTLLNILLK